MTAPYTYPARADGQTIYASILGTLETDVTRIGRQVFNVKAYGAVGDGVAGDAAAFQLAINAAIAAKGTLLIPTPTVWYRIESGLTILPTAPGELAFINIEAQGGNGLINYEGPNDTAVFTAYGWKDSTVRGLKVNLTTQNDCVIFDFINSASYLSCSHIAFHNCLFYLGSGQSPRGDRYGRDGTGGDISWITHTDCHVAAASNTSGAIAWQTLNTNMLVCDWYQCSAFAVSQFFTGTSWLTQLNGAINSSVTTLTVDDATIMASQGRVRIDTEEISYTGRTQTTLTGCTRGANGTTPASHSDNAVVYEGIKKVEGTFWYDAIGAASCHFYGCGGSGNRREFLFRKAGSFGIQGGRWEVAGRFLQTGFNGTAGPDVLVDGVQYHSASPPADNIIFALGAPTKIAIRNLSAYGSNFTSAFISANGFDGWTPGGTNYGSLLLADSSIQSAGTTLWTLPAAWTVHTSRSSRIDSSLVPQAMLAGAGRMTLGAAATDAATTQALANLLRQALIDLGLGQT